MPTAIYGYRLNEGIRRTIESAVPGVSKVVLMRDGAVRVEYPSALSAYQKSALDSLLTERGYAVLSVGYSTLVGSEKVCDDATVTEDADWQRLGSAFAGPGAVVSDIVEAFGLVVGSFRTQGASAQMRIVEDDGSTEVEVCPPTTLPDTAGAWSNALTVLTTVQLRPTRNLYRIDARLNGATSLEFRHVLSTLREWVVRPP